MEGEGEALAKFQKSVPQLAQLCKHEVSFGEYGPDLLLEVLKKLTRDRGLTFTPGALEKAKRRLKDKSGGAPIVETLLDDACKRQRKRLASLGAAVLSITANEKLCELNDVDFGVDFVPPQLLAYKKLLRRVGLGSVKKSLGEMFAVLKENREREAAGLDAQRPSLHTLFVGNPGTGKTTVARDYHAALKEMGYLRTGAYVEKSPAELVGDVIGAAEKNTLAALDAARGGVLFIDEAHNLCDKNNKSGKGASFGAQVLKTILKYMEDHRDDIVVVFGGYPEQIEKLLEEDPGLRQRFTEVIQFEDYTVEELGVILDQKISESGYESLDGEARKVALQILALEKNGKDFANGRAVRNLLEAAQKANAQRMQGLRDSGVVPTREQQQTLIADDFGRSEEVTPEQALAELDSFIGVENIKYELEDLLALVELCKERGKDPTTAYEPYFAFAGPPGTGKTSVARVMGKVFRGYGLLASQDVLEINSLDLMAGHVGQTKDTTEEIFKRALGGVLFIDEIGALAQAGGEFKSEAIRKLLTLLEKYRGRLVVVVAGYEHHVNAFMQLDSGLSRRFNNRWQFNAFTTEQAIEALQRNLQKDGYRIDEQAQGDLVLWMNDFRKAPNWSSGGDVRTLCNEVVKKHARLCKANPHADRNAISNEALLAAVTSLIEKKRRETHGLQETAFSSERPAYSTAEESSRMVATNTATAKANAIGVETPDDFNWDVGAEAEKVAHSLGLTHQEAMKAMTDPDPQSLFIQTIGKNTGQSVQKVVKKIVEVQKKAVSLPKSKGWICMFCHNSLGPNCAYVGRVDREKFNAVK